MPKIAIDVSPLYDGNAQRGVGFYTKRLVDALQHEVTTNPDYKNYQIDLIKTIDDQRSKSYDLIHYPYFDPFKLTLPFKPSAPFIISLHDLIPIEFKEHFPAGIKGNLKWLIQKFLAHRAKYIITISHHSKYVISDLLGYDPQKMYVTYLAADKMFQPCDDHKILDKIKHKYNLPDKFVLYVGDINWNKNVPHLVDACLANKYPLVIVGSSAVKEVPTHPWTTDLHWLQSKYKELGGNQGGQLILTGFVPDEDVHYFYNLATIYCQPSYAEGFGLSPVEAMQSGCPVAYSDRGAVAEVMDYNGQMFNPDSVKSISHALASLWDNPKLRQEFIINGLKRAQIFDWKYTALQTLAVYKLALVNEKH